MIDTIHKFIAGMGIWSMTAGQVVMLGVAVALIVLAIRRGIEPLVLLPVGLGAFMANLPGTVFPAMPDAATGSVLSFVSRGMAFDLLPLLIMFGIGAMTDLGPLLTHPRTLLLGIALQVGVFAALIAAAAIGFPMRESAAIGIIGGLSGPVAVFFANKLAPHLLGAIAVSSYLGTAVVAYAFSRREAAEESASVEQKPAAAVRRPVSRRVRMAFPLAVLLIGVVVAPAVAPALAMLMGGNLVRESGVVERFTRIARNELLRISAIILGACVGLSMSAPSFLRWETAQVLLLGLFAAACSAACSAFVARGFSSSGRGAPLRAPGILSDLRNPPAASAMGPSMAGMIGTAVAAGVVLAILG
jgi:oxaloacetate decarboxylase beta subunit